MEGKKESGKYRCIKGWTDLKTGTLTDIEMDGSSDGWKDRQTEGQADRRTNKWKGR
jgi:hypothetical protein